VEYAWKGIKGRARVRVLSPLPITQNFDKIPDGAVPAGWVNTQGKFFVKALDGTNKVLAKVNTSASPLVAAGNAYMGMPDLGDYTIEADVLGSKLQAGNEVNMPEVGVGACRYTLMLVGNTQSLRLVSWDAMPRVDRTINFSWEPQKWYRMKLTTTLQGGKQVVRGKVWPRDQKEPQGWTVEYTDPSPNGSGSPYLFGRVTGNSLGGTGNGHLLRQCQRDSEQEIRDLP